MAAEVIMPSLGFDMTEGKLAAWLKGEGDPVEKGEVIAEIETEKATVEIEAPVSGVLARIVVGPGRTVPVGTVIAVIAAPGEKVAAAKETAPAAPPAAPLPPAAGGESGGRAAEEPAGRDKESTGRAAEEPAGRVKASPVARRMAEEAGIDLASVAGSGPGGRVMERDVEAAIAARNAPPREAEAGAAPAGTPVPLNPMRRAIARRMALSKATAPHFYLTVEISMDKAMGLREQLNALAPDAGRISVNDLVVAAAARTLTRHPALNASYGDAGLEMHPRVHVGIAVALADGLITPVLRDADRKTLTAIAAESAALGERARAGKLRSDDLGGGTFTVSNLGMFDVDEFLAIINPPESAILAVGAVTRRPVAVGSEVRIAATMKATLSTDHRVADGAQAARFLQDFRKLLENPVALLAT